MDSLANVLEELGHQADCGPWRNFFLIGAYELLHCIHAPPVQTMRFDKMMALELSQLTDTISIRQGGPKTTDEGLLIIDWYLTDMEEDQHLTLSNCALASSNIGPKKSQ
jgi:alkyl sulfatase BDS1-like metallo-beta-lactamase superfamily hydrolase